jgi:hypothetical protein
LANVVPIPIKPAKRTPRPKLVHQSLVVLSGTNPLVWRRIQVPEKYSFWDLHVAIQDAMGWLDYHLHEFRLLDAAEQNVVSIGIPTEDDPDDRPVVPGWKVPLSKPPSPIFPLSQQVTADGFPSNIPASRLFHWCANFDLP